MDFFSFLGNLYALLFQEHPDTQPKYLTTCFKLIFFLLRQSMHFCFRKYKIHRSLLTIIQIILMLMHKVVYQFNIHNWYTTLYIIYIWFYSNLILRWFYMGVNLNWYTIQLCTTILIKMVLLVQIIWMLMNWYTTLYISIPQYIAWVHPNHHFLAIFFSTPMWSQLLYGYW
jgi:hypothetical protein